MHKELTILLKLLNGNMEKAPAFLQKVIVQYQWQHAFYGAACLVIAIALFVIAYKIMAKRKAKINDLIPEYGTPEKAAFYLDDLWGFGVVLFTVFAVLAGVILLCCFVYNFGCTISPITSITHSLVSD